MLIFSSSRKVKDVYLHSIIEMVKWDYSRSSSRQLLLFWIQRGTLAVVVGEDEDVSNELNNAKKY
jgi:hypothetical protein